MCALIREPTLITATYNKLIVNLRQLSLDICHYGDLNTKHSNYVTIPISDIMIAGSQTDKTLSGIRIAEKLSGIQIVA